MDVAVGQAAGEAEAFEKGVFGDLGKGKVELWGSDGLVDVSVVRGGLNRRGEGVFGEIAETNFGQLFCGYA